MPPTETRGRTHTSTITIAVIDPSVANITIKESDLRIEWFSGTGCGGQHKNKHQNSCRLIHTPTGITQTAQTRSRENSYKLAYSELVKLVEQTIRNSHSEKTADIRKNQIGSGMRGDKVLTIRFQDNTVVDHRTEKKMQADKFMRGFMDELWR